MPNDQGSSARSTNGSYSTPIGSSGWPQRLQVAPNSPSRPTRLVSAMPSSMCCPAGFSRQCRIVSLSSANQSRPPRQDHTPTLLTQPPRLVLELTSGLTVTIRFPASGAARLRSSRARPSAAWVVPVPAGGRPRAPGVSGGSLTGTGVPGRAARGGRARGGLGGPVGELLPGQVGADAEAAGELGDLRGGQQRGVILRMALDGQAVALDRVGEDHGRAGVVDLREGLIERPQVVTAKVAHRLPQRLVGDGGEDVADGVRARAVTWQ